MDKIVLPTQWRSWSESLWKFAKLLEGVEDDMEGKQYPPSPMTSRLSNWDD